MKPLAAYASVADWREGARARLPNILFDYIDGGSWGEQTLRANTAAFAEVMLDQRVMIDVSASDASVSLFGETLSMPLILAPVGFSGMYARRGEAQAARAAQAAGIPFCLSTMGICSIEEVTAAAKAPWFQLYMIRDRSWMEALLARAKAAGCGVLVITADLQTSGTRYRDVRSGFARRLSVAEQLGRLFEGIRKADWTRDVYFGGRPHSFGNLDGVLPPAASFAMAWEWINANFDPSVTWDDLAFVRKHWQGPIVIKGIMTVADARAAADHGVDGIIVSNHGGRQLDGGPASLSVLPGIADAVADQLTVLMDGGVRSGIDVVKAIKLGARACLIGRPWAYALATAGEAGVAQMLAAMKNEIRVTQTLSAHLRF